MFNGLNLTTTNTNERACPVSFSYHFGELLAKKCDYVIAFKLSRVVLINVELMWRLMRGRQTGSQVCSFTVLQEQHGYKFKILACSDAMRERQLVQNPKKAEFVMDDGRVDLKCQHDASSQQRAVYIAGEDEAAKRVCMKILLKSLNCERVETH